MIPTLNSFDFKDKTVLVRVDLNSPFDSKKKKIVDNERIASVKATVNELSRKKAKVVLLAHQGREGDEDFVSLHQHAKLLEKHLKRKVMFVDDVVGEKAKLSIKNLRPGDILLLDNVRFVKDEQDEDKALEGKSTIVNELAPLADIFVNDAFSVSHRAQGSVVGFTKRLPSCFGRLMEDEIKSVERAIREKGNHVLVLGGAKSDDCIDILDHILKTDPDEIEYALLCGVTANIFMKANGMEIGKKSEDLIKKKDMWKEIEPARELLKKFPQKLILPEDVAIISKGKRLEVSSGNVPKDGEILDIGKNTIKKYETILKLAKTVILKGPPGLYEDKRFSKGTKEIFGTVSNSKAYSIVGGGDTTQAIEKLKISKKKFSHISLGGGALITYLSGKSMPGIKAIKEGKQ